LAAQIEAAHEIGVKTPVYLSAGFDEKLARRHPEWLNRKDKEDTIKWEKPAYHVFCMNTPYLDYLLKQIEEVVKNYDCDGIFLDIVGVRKCFCQYCVRSLLAEGLDPYDDDNAAALAEKVYANYCKRVRAAIDAIKPGLPLFHNGGHIRRGRRDLADFDTHLELESLPTGGWGYDHFPLSAAYSRTLGKQFLGMTGKFHTTWGEFGGFKHPNALRYEEALCVAFGAKCSIGDQLHPDGHMETATYDLIGAAYSEIEEREPWLDGVESVADIAVLSQEAINNYYAGTSIPSSGKDADVGAVRMMLEGKYLFDVVDTENSLDKYSVLILPDTAVLDGKLTRKIKSFTARGGKVLATGLSGTDPDGAFALDFGCGFNGKTAHRPVYFRPKFDLGVLGDSAFVIYEQAYDISPAPGSETPIEREDPYFDRSTFAFSSHQHTPNDPSKRYPAAGIGPDGAYIAAELFTEYARKGSLISKLIVFRILDELLGENKTLSTDLPACGVACINDQKSQKRLVAHFLYAAPVKRGNGIEVIEDIVPLYGVKASIKLSSKPKRVYLAPENTDFDFSYENGRLDFTIEKLDMRVMVVIDY
ncbi:MAG: beta-galactosidase trimerization domain-containing protein, partial [Clostridia bacterium]|nr:beta-galactosidase trimerization domain-containing protein [Clostridia bacterium]